MVWYGMEVDAAVPGISPTRRRDEMLGQNFEQRAEMKWNHQESKQRNEDAKLESMGKKKRERVSAKDSEAEAEMGRSHRRLLLGPIVPLSTGVLP